MSLVSKIYLGFIFSLFILWGSLFIWKSSIVGIDGKRYFVLFDDAMISMKYAKNIVDGKGPYWNRGDTVEGYTNPLWVVIMLIPNYFLPINYSSLFIQILGLLFLILNGYLVILIVESLHQIPKNYKLTAEVITLFLTFTYYPLLYFSLMGMETSIISFLLLLGIYALLKKSFGLLLVVQILLYLVRPDNVIFYSIFFFTSLSFLNFKQVVKMYVLVLSIIMAHVALRFYFYHQLLPNTYVLKVTGWTFSERFANGLLFLRDFFNESIYILAALVIGIIFIKGAYKYVFASFVIIAILYQLSVGGDAWNYWRITAPVFPELFIIVALLITQVAANYSKVLMRYNVLSVFLMFFVISKLLYHDARFIPEMIFAKPMYQKDVNTIDLNFALGLNEFLGQNGVVGVACAGVIPYFSNFYNVDLLGKNDAYIARLPIHNAPMWFNMKTTPGHNKYDFRWTVKKYNPDVLQYSGWYTEDLQYDQDYNYYMYVYKGVTFFLRKDSANIKIHG